MAHAQGVHVLWMLSPFIKYDKLVVRSGPDPKIVFKDDSVLLKVRTLCFDILILYSMFLKWPPV